MFTCTDSVSVHVYVLLQATHYSTDHIMLTMGGDFWYEGAHVNFKNMDKLIQYVNNRVNMSDLNLESPLYIFLIEPS